jgi:hypothetical protein
MEILDQRENSSVHLHELDKGHTFATELSLEVDVENLCESSKDNIDLLVTKDLKGCLILELKASLVNQEKTWKTK